MTGIRTSSIFSSIDADTAASADDTNHATSETSIVIVLLLNARVADASCILVSHSSMLGYPWAPSCVYCIVADSEKLQILGH